MILNLLDDDFVLQWGNKQHRFFDWGKTNACVQRCDDTTLVQFSSPLGVTTEDFDAQTAAFCDLKFVNNSYGRGL